MRTIRLAEGVFNKIVGTDREISPYERFMNVEKTITHDPKNKPLLNRYRELVTSNVDVVQELAHLEDLIILRRIRSNRDIQLSTQRDYVYARQACPRSDTKNQDIRICVARVEPYDVNNLEGNVELMERADQIVCEYLDDLIKEKESIIKILNTKTHEEERSFSV